MNMKKETYLKFACKVLLINSSLSRSAAESYLAGKNRRTGSYRSNTVCV